MNGDFDPVILACLNLVAEPIFILDSSGRCIFANTALSDFLSIDGLLQRSLSTKDFWPELAASQNEDGEFHAEFRTVDGREFDVRLSATTVSDGCRFLRLLAGRSRGEALEYFHGHRLQTLGVLAGGIAHDFNNILAGILGHITYLRTVLPSSGEHSESLVAVEEGARRASSMTQQILNFSKMDDEERATSVELCDLVARMCKLLRGAISPEFSLLCDVPGSAVPVLAGEARLAQVVVNLVINARDALDRGGRIEVKVSKCSDVELLNKVFCGCDLSSRMYAVLSVKDDGVGMSKEVRERVFEPFFSTKKGSGTGLGLATVYEIVKVFGGAIDIQSEVGRGTCVSVYLPLIESATAAGEMPRAKTHEKLPQGSERILVVDDEYPVRNVLAMSLQHLGYEVCSVASGAEALDRVSNRGERYDLVILDMLMPQMSGEDVFFRLLGVDPNVRVLLISGFTSQDSIDRVLSHGGRGFIQKPFTIEDLSKKVRESLDE